MLCFQDQRKKVLNILSSKSLREQYVGLLRPVELRRCIWKPGGGLKKNTKSYFFQRPMAGSTWSCIWHVEQAKPVRGYLEVWKEGSSNGQRSMPQAKNGASCCAHAKWQLQNYCGTSSEPIFVPLNHIAAKANLVHHFQKLRSSERTTIHLRLPLWSCG